jgi:hypothetical protein
MVHTKSWIAFIAALSLAGCAIGDQGKTNTFCDRNPEICFIAGALVIGGIVGLAAAASHSNHAAAPEPVMLSDARLKADIRPAGTLANGLKFYAFHYVGDRRVFVSVMAQDLLADPRFRDAVSVDAKGFYRVNLATLGVKVENGVAMLEAGERAELLAGARN